MQVRFSQLACTLPQTVRHLSLAAQEGERVVRRRRRLRTRPSKCLKILDRRIRAARNRKVRIISGELSKPRQPGFRVLELVRSRRLELPRVLPHSDLNAARLPIPPRPHAPAWNFRLLASDCGLVKRRTTKNSARQSRGGSSRSVAAMLAGTPVLAMCARNLALALTGALDTRACDRHCLRQSRAD